MHSMAMAHTVAYRLTGRQAEISRTGQVTIAVVVAVLALAGVVAAGHVFVSYRKLRRSSEAGRRVSAAKASANPETSFDKHGDPSDPLNVKVIGTRGQLSAAFAAAGWYRADEIDLVTSARISYDSVLGHQYSTAPVSNLYLYGRKEDYAFERPGSSVRNRDHVRFWDTGQRGDDGRRIFVGGATHDIAVELSKKTHLPTHKIAPDVDDERTTVVDTVIGGNWVIEHAWESGFPAPTTRTNSLGDSYHTDGRRAVLTLANVFAPLPIIPARGTAGLRIRQTLARTLSWRLPQRARDLAARHFAEKKAHAAGHAAAHSAEPDPSNIHAQPRQ